MAALVANETLKIDGAIGASGATIELVDRLETAGPYGSGHSQPVFAVPAHRLRDARTVGERHVKVTLEAMDGSRLDGIAFRAAETSLGTCCSIPAGQICTSRECSARISYQGARRHPTARLRRGAGEIEPFLVRLKHSVGSERSRMVDRPARVVAQALRPSRPVDQAARFSQPEGGNLSAGSEAIGSDVPNDTPFANRLCRDENLLRQNASI